MKMKRTNKQTWKQIGSLLLSVCMVFTMLPTAAFAEEGGQDSTTPSNTSKITAFADLAEEIVLQEVEAGTTEEELNLPSTLTVTVTTGSAITATVSGEDATTDGDVQKTETQEETTAVVSEWTADPAYDGATVGDYVYTPTLNMAADTTLAEGVLLPHITVTVKAADTPMLLRAGIQPLGTGTDITDKFTDLNFRAEVLKVLVELGKKADDPIYDTDKFDSVKSLSISYKSIASLEGIEYFKELTYLNCQGNKLTELDVSKNTALTKLYCSSNKLTELDVSKNTALTHLFCDSNDLKQLNVSMNTALDELNCNINKLTKLNVSMNTALKELRCSSNKLTELNVSQNTKLKDLQCNNNQLMNLDVTKNTMLLKLLCDNNQLTKLDVTKNTILAFLNCSLNYMQSRTVVTGLKTEITKSFTFDPQKTRVTEVTLNQKSLLLYSNTSPKTANLTITVKPTDATDKSVTWQSSDTSVATVDESGKITAISNGTATITVTTIDGGYTDSCVVTVDSATDITAKFEDAHFLMAVRTALGKEAEGTVPIFDTDDFASVTSLSISNSGIKSLVGIEYFTALTKLDCSVNHLAKLDVSKNTALTELDCSVNHLEKLDVSKNTVLAELDCSGNYMPNKDAVTGLNEDRTTFIFAPQYFKVTGVTLEKTSLSLYSNTSPKTEFLKTTVKPDNATNKSVTWQSSNTSVATVDKLGTITAIGNGTATITATTIVGGYTASCDVTVRSATDITAKFEDANFLAEVRTLLQKGVNDRIYDADVVSLSSITIDNRSITSLAGIEYFTVLNYLDCSNNDLTKLDVSKNTALVNLYCSNNDLTKLDVSKNNALERLSCSNNDLTELDVNKNTELIDLGCSNNKLTKLEVSKNTKLYVLDCDNNKLTELDVSKNMELGTLNCFNNELTKLSVNKWISTLDCSLNYLKGESAIIGLDKSLTSHFTFVPQKSSTSTYVVTVNSGTANSSTAVANAVVTITANAAASGKRFKEWTVISGGVTLTNSKAASTTFTMPAKAVAVTATYEDIPASVTPVTGVTLNKNSLSLYSNTSPNTATLTATVAPASATDKSVTWQSSNTAVATVDASGNIKATGNGTATITVTTTDGGYTASCTVTVSTYSSGGDSPSGGSSGGSSPSGDSATNATTVTGNQPNLPVTAAAPITAKAGTNGAASASIPDNSISDAITKAQADAKALGKTTNGISVALNVTMPKEATALTATLSRNALNSLVSAGVANLEINGSPVTVTFDQKALTEIQKKSSGNINITIAPQTNLSKTAKKMLGTRPVYNIAVNYGNNSTVSSFGGGVATVAIPYTPANGEEIGGLYVVYVDEKGNATRVESSAYDANSGCVIFTTLHFSMYGVGYTAPSAKFTDIGSHWAKESIDYAVGRGLFSGTTQTTFAPDTAITRTMLATALGRLAGVDVSSYTTSSFTDVKAGSTYQPYIEWAYKKGMMQGIGNNQFAPDRAITREEIAVMIANFAKATGDTLPVTREATTYADAASIGSTYKTAVTAMQQAGIMMGGTSNKFTPKSNATRAEVSSMLHPLVKLIIDPDTAQGWAQNDAGQYLYYKEGKALTGTQTIEGVKYFFDANAELQTGWVKDSDNLRYYSGNSALVGWQDIDANGSNKRYYFNKDGIMMSGKWLKIDGKWYYFYTDGSLAKSIKIDDYEVDENGVRKMK